MIPAVTDATNETPAADASDGLAWHTPGVRGIGLASFLAMSGTRSQPPCCRHCRRQRSARPPPHSTEGIADASAGLARLAGGAIADDPQRRRSAAVGGYAATAVLSSLIGVCTNVWQVGGRLAKRSVGGSRPARARTKRVSGRLGARKGIRTRLRLRAIHGQPRSDRRATSRARNADRVQRPRHDPTLGHSGPARRSRSCARSARHRATAGERVPLRLRVRPVLRGDLRRLFVGISAFEC